MKGCMMIIYWHQPWVKTLYRNYWFEMCFFIPEIVPLQIGMNTVGASFENQTSNHLLCPMIIVHSGCKVKLNHIRAQSMLFNWLSVILITRLLWYSTVFHNFPPCYLLWTLSSKGWYSTTTFFIYLHEYSTVESSWFTRSQTSTCIKGRVNNFEMLSIVLDMQG